MLLAIVFLLAACRKSESILPKANPETNTAINELKTDTMPYKAAFNVKLLSDSTAYDETAIVFCQNASSNYVFNEDAPYFTGFGQGSLSTISADNIDLGINCLPYTPGMAIRLNVHTKVSGAYLFKISYENKIPATINVWVKDSYMKDSLDMSKGNYSFYVNKADTNSFGGKRFSLVLKDSRQ
jgi:trimeric autotransporter adhesin